MGRRWWGDGESRQDPWEGVGERHPGAGGGGGGSASARTPHRHGGRDGGATGGRQRWGTKGRGEAVGDAPRRRQEHPPGLEPAPGAAEGLGVSRVVNPNPKRDGGAGGEGKELEPPAACPRRAGRVAAAGAWLPARPASPHAASRLPARRSLSAFPDYHASLPPPSSPHTRAPHPAPGLAPRDISAHFERGFSAFVPALGNPLSRPPALAAPARRPLHRSPLRQRWGKTGSCLVIDSPPPAGPPRHGSARHAPVSR